MAASDFDPTSDEVTDFDLLERSLRANVTKINQLIKDGETRRGANGFKEQYYTDADREEGMMGGDDYEQGLWYDGFVFGLKRALSVLEGRG